MFNQKILVIGNETIDTDIKVSELARESNTINHGLLVDFKLEFVNIGYYHTSVADLSPGEIVHISDKFDTVLLLDQPKESFSHFKSYVTTIRLMFDLELTGINIVYRDNKFAKQVIHWRQFLKDNKSFCFHPFLALINIDNEVTCICPKNSKPITKVQNIIDWQTDLNYKKIRDKMLSGELISERCYDCYDREAEGQESTRQFETLEWAIRIDANSTEDFTKIKSPLYYEIKPNNLCNIMCRTCDDARSHLIEREWKSIGIPLTKLEWIEEGWESAEISLSQDKFNGYQFDKIDFDTVERIYWGGGEPTVMPEFYEFLEKCIAIEHTSFELEIGTNGMKISNKLLSLLEKFNNVNFALSYDGYQKINDYIRWGSNFDTVVKNSRKILDHGHKISLQSVFSMYSITRMHEVFEFYDSEYPKFGALVQVAGGMDDIIMPYNHPRPDLVIESMLRCQQTKVYYANGRSVKSMVDLLLDHYSNPSYKVNVEKLKEFYKFNDRLDQARNSPLGDYIPELEQARVTYGI
jgi:sulfatase maturation enzyme AslB (radical SAM superfamily)